MKLIASWQEWCEVFDKPEVWREEIRLISEANEVESHSVETTFPGTHAVFFVNEDIVLKIFCPVRFNSYEKELGLHEGPLKGNPLFAQIRFHGKSPSGDLVGG